MEPPVSVLKLEDRVKIELVSLDIALEGARCAAGAYNECLTSSQMETGPRLGTEAHWESG